MGQHNKTTDVQDLQHRFTAYLLTAVKRAKRDYLGKRLCIKEHELLTDFQEAQYPDCRAESLFDWPRYVSQPEVLSLMQALSQLSEKERRILYARVLDDVGYNELANCLGLRYNGIASAYRQIIRKLKKALEEVQE